MDTVIDVSSKKSSGLKGKKMILFSGAFVFLFVSYLVYYLSMSDFTGKRQAIFDEQEKNFEIWVGSTVENTVRWLEGFNEAAQNISNSDLYRLFAQDMVRLDKNINNLSTKSPDKAVGDEEEDLSALMDQLPLMQNVLKDFIQYNNILNAQIVSLSGKTLLSTIDNAQPLTNRQRELIKKTIERSTFTLDTIQKTDIGLVLYYAVPISSVDTGKEVPVAILLVTRTVTNTLDRILTSTALPKQDYIPLFLQNEDDKFVLVSNSAGKFLKEASELDIEKDKDIPFGMRQSFESKATVYSFGSKVPGTDFWIILEVPAKAVDAEITILAWRVFGLAFAICIGTFLLIALLWWIIVGREQKAIAEKFQQLYHIITQQKTILDGVNKSLSVGLALIDKGGFVHVANTAFQGICCGVEDLDKNANITTLFEGSVATKLLLEVQSLEEADQEHIFELEFEKGDQRYLYRVTLYAYIEKVNEISINGAVCIFQDITEFRRKRLEAQARQIHIIEGLLKVVESIDPYLSGHSDMLKKLSVFIAEKMNLSEKDKDIISTSAYFSQIGKVYIPRELLLKTGKLTEEELSILKQTPTYAYNILKNIDFDMPVAEVIYQMNENMNGTGYPQGLKGDEIRIYARIMAVANIFCAMTSPRSHRHAFTATQAVESIIKMSEEFDSKVIEALLAVVANHDEIRKVFQCKEKPKEALIKCFPNAIT